VRRLMVKHTHIYVGVLVLVAATSTVSLYYFMHWGMTAALAVVWAIPLGLWLYEYRKASNRHALELASWLKVGGDLRMICRPDEAHTIKFAGPGFERVLGWSKEELEGRPWAEFLHPDDHDISQRHLSTGVCGGPKNPRLAVRWKHKVALPDGSTRWVWLEWSATFVEELNLCYANARDMTSRFEREAQMSTWSRITSDLMAVTDTGVPIPQRKFEWVNEAWTRLLGWEPDELYAMFIVELLCPDEVDVVTGQRAAVEQCAEGASRIECRVLCKPEAENEPPKYQIFEWVSSDINGKLYTTGRNVGAEHAHNIEMAKAIHDLETRNRDLERFASVAAHQLRSPPRTIAGIAQALTEDYADQLDDDGRQFLEDIRSDANQMAEIVDGLYRFSKVRTSADMNTEPVDLDRLVRGLKESRLKTRCGTCDHRTTCPAPEDCPNGHEKVVQEELPTVLGDKVLLVEVFSNLIDNGFKFNESEAKQVTITAANRGDGRWDITIADNGIGIDPTYHSKLFRMFERVHPSYSGTGVGLALVAAIVDKLGGTIRVDSAPGEGTRFTFDLEGAWTA